MRTKIRRRPNGRWYVFSVDDEGHEYSHGGHRTQREAKAAALELVPKKGARYVAPSGLTVGDYLEGEWLASRGAADISPGTRALEGVMVRAWILPHIGDVPLQKLTARHLDGLYAALRASGGRGGQPLRGKSVRNCHGLLSKALKDAVRRGHLASSPVLDPPARDDSVERQAWTLDETRTFLDVASDDRLEAVWRLALATGCRRGELLGLQWPDVDDGSVTVARQVLVGGAFRMYIRETTKTRRVRRVRFDGTTAAALRSWKATQAAERLAFGPAYRTDGGHRLGVAADWIVTEPDGYVVHPDTLSARWGALVKRAGVTPISIHSARHTYAELALAAGVRLDVVSRQLGHASISTTAGNYLHDSDEAATAAAELVARTIDGWN